MGRLWGLVAGTAGAAATYYLNNSGVIDLGSDQAAAFWGAASRSSPTRSSA